MFVSSVFPVEQTRKETISAAAFTGTGDFTDCWSEREDNPRSEVIRHEA